VLRRVTATLALALAFVPGFVAALPGNSVGGPSTVTDVAVRDVQWDTKASCDLTTVTAIATRHPSTRQLVVLSTNAFGDTFGSAFVAVRDSGGTWRCQTNAVAARFGRNGTRPLLDRRSGDGTTPAGVFPLGETTAWDGQIVNVFGNQPDPGVKSGIGYRAVRQQDCWGAIPGDAEYNKLVNRPGCSGPDNEWLPRFGDVYSHAAVIGANMDPISGDSSAEANRAYAAAIFLHRHSYTSNGSTRPTSGCVSVPYDELAATINLFDPTLDPHFAIGPTSWLRASA
jgi:L,D-peptidoglycan transpeptidase YkuD (ErfK/YbiS/YcfS/YnhG family)